MSRMPLVLVAFGFLVGCASPDQIQPAVSQFNGDSVSIQVNGTAVEFMSPEDRAVVFAKADAEAARICGKGSKKRAEYTSSRNIPTGQYSYQIERLYLCLN
jgi:hypothetical protein